MNGCARGSGRKPPPRATQLGFELVLHCGYGEHVLPRQEVVGKAPATLRTVGDGHGAVCAQFVVAQAVAYRCQRVVGRHRTDKGDRPQQR